MFTESHRVFEAGPRDHPHTASAESRQAFASCPVAALFRALTLPNSTLHLSGVAPSGLVSPPDRRPCSAPQPAPAHSTSKLPAILTIFPSPHSPRLFSDWLALDVIITQSPSDPSYLLAAG